MVRVPLFATFAIRTRKGAGVVDRDGLENRCTLTGTEGSNPSLSAKYHRKMEKIPVSSLLAGIFLFCPGEEYRGFGYVSGGKLGGKNFWRKNATE